MKLKRGHPVRVVHCPCLTNQGLDGKMTELITSVTGTVLDVQGNDVNVSFEPSASGHDIIQVWLTTSDLERVK